MGSDYSQLEIDNMVAELLTVHHGKLKAAEIQFLDSIEGRVIPQPQRDKLVRLYDAIGEVGY